MTARSAVLWSTLGLGALGLVLFHTSAPEPAAPTTPPRLPSAPTAPTPAQQRRALHAVVANEGGSYTATNRNTDGRGLSFGILQWSQASGDLAALLAAFRAADPATAQRLLPLPRTLSMQPYGGANLWDPPWLDRFRAAGAHPPFQRAQDDLALSGGHMRAALAAYQRFRMTTTRDLALVLDRIVQQGPAGFARATATLGTPASALTTARACAETFRAEAPPASTPTWRFVTPELALGDQGILRAVPGSYHRFRGNIDLYTTVVKRCAAILASPDLSD